MVDRRRRLALAFFCSLLPLFPPGILSARIVTLKSIQIFRSYSWLPLKPIVYFYCEGEKQIVLPDVTETNNMYTFIGEESWQPLTELPEKKCKRCGIYQRDPIKADDVFDEWELCPEAFVDGKYTHLKEHVFNATFSCPGCAASASNSSMSSEPAKGKGTHVAAVVLISLVVSAVFIAALVAGYKYWQKRKREQDQLRFLKLFEEGDDIEDELGLGRII